MNLTKLGLLIFVFSFISGCGLIKGSSEKDNYPTEVNQNIEKYTDDYEKNIQNFNEITSDELLSMLDDKKELLVYFGRESCPYCREFVPILNTTSSGKNREIYYIDTEETENNMELKKLRENLGVEFVPSLLKFNPDGTYESFDFYDKEDNLYNFI